MLLTPTTGEMVITVTGHPLIKGDRIKIASGSLIFTCAKDNHTTQHPYPRRFTDAGGDPAFNTSTFSDRIRHQ